MEPELNDKQPNGADLKLDAPHEADCAGVDFYSCEEAVKRLNEYLDHEMTAAERADVLKHLEICRPCLSRFTFEQTLVVSLREKVSHLCIPTVLREKLFLLLREEE